MIYIQSKFPTNHKHEERLFEIVKKLTRTTVHSGRKYNIFKQHTEDLDQENIKGMQVTQKLV